MIQRISLLENMILALGNGEPSAFLFFLGGGGEQLWTRSRYHFPASPRTLCRVSLSLKGQLG